MDRMDKDFLKLHQYVLDEIKVEDSWRLFKIMAEFVDGFEVLSNAGIAVSIFGSSRTKKRDPFYKTAERLGELLVQEGITVITGGGPGIMEAVNKGAYEAKGESVGLNIKLPLEQKPNKYLTKVINFKYFFVRKVMLVKYAKAFVIFPGGFGTMDELFESLTLIQTKKIKPFPIFLVGKDYWRGLIDWLKKGMITERFISNDDLKYIHIYDEPELIVKEIVNCIENKCYDNDV